MCVRHLLIINRHYKKHLPFIDSCMNLRQQLIKEYPSELLWMWVSLKALQDTSHFLLQVN